MVEIAQDAGVAVGTLYLYFNNKDALVVACAESFIDHHRQQIDAILTAKIPADDKLRNYILARFRQSEETRRGWRWLKSQLRACGRRRSGSETTSGTTGPESGIGQVRAIANCISRDIGGTLRR